MTSYEALPDINDCYNYRITSVPNAKTACFFFHGFPGERGWKNKDIAKSVSMDMGYDCYVMHYYGLGESLGVFSFVRAVHDAESFVQRTLQSQSYEKVKVFGHSFGGFVSLNMGIIFKEKICQLVLLSPMNLVPESPHLDQLIANSQVEKPHLFVGTTSENVRSDFDRLRTQYGVRDAKHTSTFEKIDISILQAKNDSDVPEVTTQTLLPYLGAKAYYEETVSDHAFLLTRPATIHWVKQRLALR